MTKQYSGNQIRQQYIDFFVNQKGHTFVPSSSLVPGGDATLLFTNSGMVQFKDVFLGTDNRSYSRAVNSQKCMRVAGKHNDLEDVGFDDTHHTFFEMLGNWSFGDYYKKEAIEWAWELLTEVWKLPKERLYATVFKDELGKIPIDDEALQIWKNQAGMDPDHILFYGRKDNFWEMADTGPCGPNSEIHYDLGPDYGEITYTDSGHVDLDGPRFIELWNLVFIQYNRLSPTQLEPLPKKHVDTGLGLERIVAVLQNKKSNYRTDLFWPIILRIQKIAGHTDDERETHFTPYRVIADHARAAAFLIADGVVPGNLSRNYITRMIIRRAARFGANIGLDQPFLAQIAETVIEHYGKAYPELQQNQTAIFDNLTREEERFQDTVDSGIGHLDDLISKMKKKKQTVLDGELAFDLYATYGLPLEITRDILTEQNLKVDEDGFLDAMEKHRIASGGGRAMGELGGEDAETYSVLLQELQQSKSLTKAGVSYDPYQLGEIKEEVLALVKDNHPITQAKPGDHLSVILPQTNFYLAAGGQVSDTGKIISHNGSKWHIRVDEVFRPAAGMIAHFGEVIEGNPKVGDPVVSQINLPRRYDIMRNHTATHLLHATLHEILGKHARQAGSLVAPDRLRFDFTHPDALSSDQLANIETKVNTAIFDSHSVRIEYKDLSKAKDEGATALFGEKYGDTVRTVQIGEEQPLSYELCGGTHVKNTSEIGLFLITNETSAAAGIRRIEAITGRAAYQFVQQRFNIIDQTAALMKAPPEQIVQKAHALINDLNQTRKELFTLHNRILTDQFEKVLDKAAEISGVHVLTVNLPEADKDSLRQLADRFRQKYESGIAVLASVIEDKPSLVAVVTKDLVAKGINAGDLINVVAEPLGGHGGGRPDLAQAGGKDPAKLETALKKVNPWIKKKLKS